MPGEEEGSPSGLRIKPEKGGIPPPLEGEAEEEGIEEGIGRAREEEAGLRVARAGKLPLHPAVIRLPASIGGRIGTELTGYPGFTFTEQELNDLAELWVQTGVEMPPLAQAAIGTSAMVGGKFLGYFAWVRAGKKAIPGAKAIGEEEASGV